MEVGTSSQSNNGAHDGHITSMTWVHTHRNVLLTGGQVRSASTKYLGALHLRWVLRFPVVPVHISVFSRILESLGNRPTLNHRNRCKGQLINRCHKQPPRIWAAVVAYEKQVEIVQFLTLLFSVGCCLLCIERQWMCLSVCTFKAPLFLVFIWLVSEELLMKEGIHPGARLQPSQTSTLSVVFDSNQAAECFLKFASRIDQSQDLGTISGKLDDRIFHWNRESWIHVMWLLSGYVLLDRMGWCGCGTHARRVVSLSTLYIALDREKVNEMQLRFCWSALLIMFVPFAHTPYTFLSQCCPQWSVAQPAWPYAFPSNATTSLLKHDYSCLWFALWIVESQLLLLFI